MSNEAMKLALEALEYIEHNYMSLPAPAEKAITALREALAEQPAQQVVDCHATGVCVQSGLRAEQPRAFGTLAQQEPLQNNPFDCGVYLGSGKDYAIKHHVSYGPAQQEPVVWMYVNKSTHETKFQKHMRDFVDHSLWSEVPLYNEPLANHELQCVCGAVWCGDEMVHLPDKHPPAQRKPLTSEEVSDLRIKHGITSNGRGIKEFTQIVDFVRAIEAVHGIKENT